MEASQSNPKNRNRCVLMGLGAAEVALGSFCVVMGALIAGHEASHVSCFIHGLYDNEPLGSETTTGEGIWCGVWIIVAGGFGVAAGTKRSSSTINLLMIPILGETVGKGYLDSRDLTDFNFLCLALSFALSTFCSINVHMAFAIIGTLFAGVLVCVACAMVSLADRSKPFYIGIVSTIAIAAFASMILQVVSAFYCCCADKDDGCRCCCEKDQRGAAVSYENTFQLQGFAPGRHPYYVSLPGQPLNNQLLFAQQPSSLVTSPQSTATNTLINQPSQDKRKHYPRELQEDLENASNFQPPTYTPT